MFAKFGWPFLALQGNQDAGPANSYSVVKDIPMRYFGRPCHWLFLHCYIGNGLFFWGFRQKKVEEGESKNRRKIRIPRKKTAVAGVKLASGSSFRENFRKRFIHSNKSRRGSGYT